MDRSSLDILTSIRTTEEATQLRDIIDKLSQAAYQGGSQVVRDILEREAPVKWLRVLEQVFSEQNLGNRRVLKQIIDDLKVRLGTYRIMKITLAFEPSDGFVSELFRWARKNIDKPCILDVVYDERIIGGIIVEFAGKYADLSLKAKLDSFFEKKPKERRIYE